MSYFMTQRAHSGLLTSGQGGAGPPNSSLSLYGPMEPVVVAPGGPGPLSQKAERQAAPQSWGHSLPTPEPGICPGGAGWEPLRRKEYHGRYCRKFPHVRQLENLGWEDGCPRGRVPQLAGGQMGSLGGHGPLLLCGLSPGALLMPKEAGGKEPGSQPDICILTLAMMIAGIPTVPVPGLREEDMIRAAQAFMMAHPEPEGATEGRWGQAQSHMMLGQAPLVGPRRSQGPGSCL
ncbi:spermatogenesis-associated protein 25 [Sminthopsis crassicaudata]|uniref:spermatogenesis-associated protein 25 n=1 Tax=Antechinus flavipes TaxID=38775 RepID=UPI00223607A7|nr:spermatogenesis-associated protein 25 [Antechinus flavipes]